MIVLADQRDGWPLSIIDSGLITEWRTGAATAIAATWLTRDEPVTVSVIGCGVQGRIQLRSVALVRPVTTVFAHDNDVATAERFAADARTITGVPVHVVGDASERRRALAASDVVITCTTSHQPVLIKYEIRPGTFVAAVGADNPEKQEIDPELLASSTVIADVLDQATSIGDTRHAIAAGLMRREDVWAELGDVVVGSKRLDATRGRNVVFDSTGMALQDVTVVPLFLASREASVRQAVAVVPLATTVTSVPTAVAATSPWSLLWFFTKAGAFVFGSGLAVVPFLYGGVVQEHHWLTDRQFLDAVAVAMITPGPVVITVVFIGYLVDGFAGMMAAAVGVFLPVYLFVIVLAPHVRRYREQRYVKSFVEGVTAAATGAIAGAAVVLSRRAWIDGWTLVIGLVVLAVLSRWKIPEPWLIAAAAAAGLLLRAA